MAVMTPFFDIVAGVAILAGRSSLLDTKVFKTGGSNITLRHLLGLGFVGYGGWHLWKVERAQDKLKESLEAESFGAEPSYRGSGDLYDCGCAVDDYEDDWNISCKSCGYVSCLDCHYVDSTDVNPQNWKCYEGYGCNKGAESFGAEKAHSYQDNCVDCGRFTRDSCDECGNYCCNYECVAGVFNNDGSYHGEASGNVVRMCKGCRDEWYAAESFGAESFSEDEQIGGFLTDPHTAVMIHLTGLTSAPIGIDEFGTQLRRLDEESQIELMNRIMKRAKKRRSKRGQEEAEQMMKILRDNDFTFLASYGFDAESFSAEPSNANFSAHELTKGGYLEEIEYTCSHNNKTYHRYRMIENPKEGWYGEIPVCWNYEVCGGKLGVYTPMAGAKAMKDTRGRQKSYISHYAESFGGEGSSDPYVKYEITNLDNWETMTIKLRRNPYIAEGNTLLRVQNLETGETDEAIVIHNTDVPRHSNGEPYYKEGSKEHDDWLKGIVWKVGFEDDDDWDAESFGAESITAERDCPESCIEIGMAYERASGRCEVCETKDIQGAYNMTHNPNDPEWIIVCADCHHTAIYGEQADSFGADMTQEYLGCSGCGMNKKNLTDDGYCESCVAWIDSRMPPFVAESFGAETICESCEVNKATHRYNPRSALLCGDCLEKAEEANESGFSQNGYFHPYSIESLYAESFGAESFETHCHDCGKELARLSAHEPHICYDCDKSISDYIKRVA